MKVQLERDGESVDINRLVIEVEDVEFRISLNKFNELVVNKHQLGSGDSALNILPSTSNEIRIK